MIVSKQLVWRKATSGFTLIELLVVIAIIGILAGVVLASLNSSRANARDANRLSQLDQIQKALNVYFLEHGHYPREGIEDTGSGEICGTCTGGINAILNTYMGGVPEDPRQNSNNNAAYNPGEFYYYYDGMHLCGGNPNKAVVAAISMENNSNSNVTDTMCTSWGGEGSIGRAGSYMIILGDSG